MELIYATTRREIKLDGLLIIKRNHLEPTSSRRETGAAGLFYLLTLYALLMSLLYYQTRVALVARATDMIKVRENTFETVLEEDLIKAYEGADTYSVIVFDPSAIDKAKTEIAKLSDNKAVRVYVFSLANDSYVSDFADLDRQVELCPIPESILEVYKRIFDQKGTK